MSNPLSTGSAFSVPEVIPGTIHLARGIPARQNLPAGILSAGLADAAERVTDLDIAYGFDSLPQRDLASLIAARVGVPDDEIFITNGCMHGTSLALSAFLEPGGTLAIEDPTYPDTLVALELLQPEVVPIPVDENGLDVDVLEARLRAGVRPQVLYTVPDFHNPTGVTLSAERRRRLVELAEHYGFLILADNPYRDLHFHSPAPRFPRSDRMIELGTFSKTLGPGLRVGWAQAAPAVVERLEALRRRQDYFSSSLSRAAVAFVLASKEFDSALATARADYASRAETLADAFDSLLPEYRFRRADGGLFLWGRFDDPDIAPAALLRAAVARGVTYSLGSYYASGDKHAWDGWARFCFGAADADNLVEAVQRLAGALSDVRTATFEQAAARTESQA